MHRISRIALMIGLLLVLPGCRAASPASENWHANSQAESPSSQLSNAPAETNADEPSIGESSLPDDIDDANEGVYESEDAEPMDKDKSSASEKVYGVDFPLPTYEELVNNIGSFKGKRFALDGRIVHVGYHLQTDYAHYSVKWDEDHAVIAQMPTVMYSSIARGNFSAIGTLEGTDGSMPKFFVNDRYVITDFEGKETVYDYQQKYMEKQARNREQ